jgi:hypothetical protein
MWSITMYCIYPRPRRLDIDRILTMPYKSKAQEAYFNANRGRLEAQGVDVAEWNQASKGKKLPAKVKTGKKAKKRG